MKKLKQDHISNQTTATIELNEEQEKSSRRSSSEEDNESKINNEPRERYQKKKTSIKLNQNEH